MTYTPQEFPRNICEILILMIPFIPTEHSTLIKELHKTIKRERYQAPEIQNWGSVANTLSFFMQPYEEEEWAINVLKIWRNEEIC